MLGIVSGSNVVLSTPTGSGKSLVAIGAHLAALARGERTYYTAPIKALVNEKFFALVALFGADRVGLVTGDTAVNADAPIVCCTAEILAGIALRHGASAPVGQVVMDEFHFYADPDRGWAWQVPLLTMPHTQFLLMSATLGDMSVIADDLERRTGRETVLVTGVERPVPLSFEYALTPVHESIDELLNTARSPVYIVHFSQAEALERAQSLTSSRIIGPEGKQAIADAIGDFRFSTAFGRILSGLLRQGIGVHHAGMLPRYRRLVEQLAQEGHLRVICGTDTLGVGINVPIRTVLVTALVKYDGTRMRRLSAREFHQVAGRAGRAGYDTMGTVVVQAPEYEIENAKRVAKAGDDPKKLARVHRVKPQEGTVSWSRATFDKLVEADPEPLSSRMRITHAMVLAVLAGALEHDGDAVAMLRDLIDGSHEPRRGQLRLAKRALPIGRTLVDAGIVERTVVDNGSGASVVRYRLTIDLQTDFALDQPLSPFAVEVLESFDPEAPEYALDAVSVIEATLEDPRPIVSQQEHLARGEAVAAMKAEGIEYEERMALLEEITWPRPLAELLEAMFSTYRASTPWAAEFELAPKSVVRDMWERAMDFAQFVRHYGLVRSEGLVLRYLTDAYRALRRTVPQERRTEALADVIEWLGAIVRGVDSSLLDEWQASGGESAAPGPPDRRGLRTLARNAMFHRVQLAARRRWAELGELDADSGFGATAWAEAFEPYFDEHDDVGIGADARGPALWRVTEQASTWLLRQVIDDPAGDHDWRIDAELDVAASEAAGEPVMTVTAVGRL